MLKSKQFKEFLENNLYLVDKLEIQTLYDRAEKSSDDEWHVVDLTDALIECGLNPLEHMETVPADYAWCRSEFDLTIPDNITSIKDNAFAFCNNSPNKQLVIPGNCYEIGPMAFQSCLGLASIFIHDGCEIIDNEAFYGCSGVRVIRLPKTLKWIGQDAFADITYKQKLRITVDITYDGTTAQWRHISEDAFGGTRYICHCVDGDVESDGNNQPFGHN